MNVLRYFVCWGAEECKKHAATQEALGNIWVSFSFFNSIKDIEKFKEKLKEKLSSKGIEWTDYESISGDTGAWEYSVWLWTDNFPDKPSILKRRALHRAIRHSATSVGYLAVRGVTR